MRPQAAAEGAEGEPRLSKRGQRREANRAEGKQRKRERKAEGRRAEITLALAAARSLTCGCPACPGYAALPLVAAPAGLLEALQPLVVRPPRYDEKYLPQEASLIAKVWALARGPEGALVLEVGGGNGNLALFLALLGFQVICLDRDDLREELRAELRAPADVRPRLRRWTLDIGDLSTEQLRPV